MITEAAEGAIISVRNLGYEVDRAPILQGIDFEISAGENVTIIGPNGAGKTTVLRCLARLIEPTRGEIVIAGRPIGSWHRRALARRLSYVPQSGGRMLPFTVHEFILMGRYAHYAALTGPSQNDRRVTDEVLERTGLTPLAERSLQNLSGGERQKVFIAASLAQGAEVLLLDEPTTFLDYRHQVEVLSLIESLNREDGCTVVSVTHDLNRGVFESDRVLAIKEGHLSFCGTPDELTEPGRLETIFETPFERIRHPRTGQRLVMPLSGVTTAGDAAESAP